MADEVKLTWQLIERLVPLTNLQRERETQRLQALLRKISTKDLRLARAWYADLLSEDRYANLAELIKLRGELIHQAVEAREGVKRRLFGGPPKVTSNDFWNQLVYLKACHGPWKSSYRSELGAPSSRLAIN